MQLIRHLHASTKLLFYASKSSTSVQLTTLTVNSFDNETLNRILSESFCLPLRRTKRLTEIILQKTDGIIIHIIEFISRLADERHLCHSFVKGWEWDDEVIENCPISETVAELITMRLKSLSEDALIGLQICALLGTKIEQRIINFLRGYDGDNSVNINAALKAAAELGIVETNGSSGDYKFTHDIIAQVSSTRFDISN